MMASTVRCSKTTEMCTSGACSSHLECVLRVDRPSRLSGSMFDESGEQPC